MCAVTAGECRAGKFKSFELTKMRHILCVRQSLGALKRAPSYNEMIYIAPRGARARPGEALVENNICVLNDGESCSYFLRVGKSTRGNSIYCHLSCACCHATEIFLDARGVHLWLSRVVRQKSPDQSRAHGRRFNPASRATNERVVQRQGPLLRATLHDDLACFYTHSHTKHENESEHTCARL